MSFAVFFLALQGALAPAEPLTDAPTERRIDPYFACRCEAEQPDNVVTITGIVRDAELRLAPDGLSVLPEQTTVFTVISSSDPEIKGQVKIRHLTKPEDCGLGFDYGKRYEVRATRVSKRLETNWCLDPRRAPTNTTTGVTSETPME